MTSIASANGSSSPLSLAVSHGASVFPVLETLVTDVTGRGGSRRKFADDFERTFPGDVHRLLSYAHVCTRKMKGGTGSRKREARIRTGLPSNFATLYTPNGRSAAA